MTNSTNHETENETKADAAQADEQSATIKAALDQREAELKDLEADLERRLTNVKDREAKSEAILEKANGRVRKIRSETNEELDTLKKAHQAEIERLRHEKPTTGTSNNASADQDVPTPTQQPSAQQVPEGVVNTEDLPRPTVTDDQLNNWIRTNPGAKRVVVEQIKNNMNKAMKGKNETLAKLQNEVEELKAQKSLQAPAAVKEEPEQSKPQNLEEEWTKVKADHNAALKEALTKKEEAMNKMFTMRSKIKDSTITNYRNKCNVVEKAAKETPTEEVAKVWALATEQAKNPPAAPNTPVKPQVPAPAHQHAPVQPLAPGQTPNASTSQAQQAAATTPNSSQANDTNVSLATQSAPQQQPNPFLQTGHGTAPNPFALAQNQMGRGLQQPGFTGQAQVPPAQQQQQFGRGRGDGVGTGPQALRGVLQSNLPRGGATSIPLPGSRGRGQQQQHNQNQGPGTNAQGPGVSQIGRGGGRGGSRGRGQAHNVQGQANVQNQGSPGRGGLNASALQFLPGAGRGQKRGAEDDSEGGARGGKRPRGRGGQGGGGGAGGAAPASGTE
ncbi:uncharacterized protein K460DRAFT_105049 [Cucurbitaria berberidis CBS 394.84]|uniref:Uncharacterized protein n=1 Tax=Cucurbitaria berberidis CBS 394.84 TaxID=1168544 RepID=A0A9P4L8F6_9PLEO|nr:uncharacterized protein K460DRAFT_105049 [Cucurbitaria berberidis CBS 394.84]KAF1845213.1 hypothetical protein K460DRAFT_105049 [Cucurbitaria berberidis CBS 394.84]